MSRKKPATARPGGVSDRGPISAAARPSEHQPKSARPHQTTRDQPESAARRLRQFLAIGAITVLGPASMDIYLPGLPRIARDFGAQPSTVQLTVTTFLVGLALGQLISGPISDSHGRRRPLLIGLTAFTAASLACAFAPDLYTLASLRLLQGAFAAAGMAIGRAIVRDLYAGADAARYLSRLMLIIGLAPILAPVAGGEILKFGSWGDIFAAVAALGAVCVLAAARFLPETHPVPHRRPGGPREAAASIKLLLDDRDFVLYGLIIGFGYGAMVSYLAGSSFVLETVYGISPRSYGALFGINALFLVAGAQLNARLVRRHETARLLGLGVAMMTLAGAGLLAMMLVTSAPLTAVLLPLTLLMFSWSFIQANALALALTAHPRRAGTAAALLGTSQFAFGATVAPLPGLAGAATGVPMALLICACGVAASAAARSVLRFRIAALLDASSGEGE